jgi:hypothetical protein
MLQYEYARSGLELEQELGVNPFKFGMIGSTDSHTSLATAGQDNLFGKHSGAEPNLPTLQLAAPSGAVFLRGPSERLQSRAHGRNSLH